VKIGLFNLLIVFLYLLDYSCRHLVTEALFLML